ncbi:flagellar protein FliS [Gracilibacillus halophilus YIM-C55.5]|uniref:Flagellar secretion chaperone FliS n=1 Tax=Gracilibacillus halophilus YIM-C55.5 TaxID=1308866 RepID=N4WDS4_9BACI|nr:flagellar export chaperone FliS [Gracilibacillus halophilus]ENH98418.1 flagellar protein FliS [Gracilibacillus halophilus YIM-C55.5]
MSYQQYQAYQNNSVETASPSELTLMLYNGCIKFIKQAKKAIDEGNIQDRNNYIQRAQNIIRELMVTLDQDAPIAQEIMPLYDFVHYNLTQGNVNNNKEALQEAEDIVVDFRDTWKEVIKQERKRTYGQGTNA